MPNNDLLDHLKIKTLYPLTLDGAFTLTCCTFGSGFSTDTLTVSTEHYMRLLDDILDSLKPVDNLVLRMRFNSKFGFSHTLEEIGQSLGVTRERVRQIQVKALRKMRHPSRSDKIFNSFQPSLLEKILNEP